MLTSVSASFSCIFILLWGHTMTYYSLETLGSYNVIRPLTSVLPCAFLVYIFTRRHMSQNVGKNFTFILGIFKKATNANRMVTNIIFFFLSQSHWGQSNDSF